MLALIWNMTDKSSYIYLLNTASKNACIKHIQKRSDLRCFAGCSARSHDFPVAKAFFKRLHMEKESCNPR